MAFEDISKVGSSTQFEIYIPKYSHTFQYLIRTLGIGGNATANDIEEPGHTAGSTGELPGPSCKAPTSSASTDGRFCNREEVLESLQRHNIGQYKIITNLYR